MKILVSSIGLIVTATVAMWPGRAGAANPAKSEDPKLKKYLAASQAAVAKIENQFPEDIDLLKTRLRKVHEGLFKLLVANKGIWPQVPVGITQNEDVTAWWKSKLKRFEVEDGVWMGEPNLVITNYDDQPLSAYRWGGMPWVVSEAPCHGVTYIVMADGAIQAGPIYDPKLLGPGIEIPRRLPFGLEGSAKIPEELLRAIGKEQPAAGDAKP